LEKAHPDAKLDLDFTNPLELLIALILAAQARDDLVRQVTVELFKKNRKAEDFAQTSLPRLEEQIRKINFYRNKAKSIQNCCKEQVQRFGGQVPDRLDDLLTLPGVGRKTANIVLNALGNKPSAWTPTSCASRSDLNSRKTPIRTRSSSISRRWCRKNSGCGFVISCNTTDGVFALPKARAVLAVQSGRFVPIQTKRNLNKHMLRQDCS
jgi:hypothetical protein